MSRRWTASEKQRGIDRVAELVLQHGYSVEAAVDAAAREYRTRSHVIRRWAEEMGRSLDRDVLAASLREAAALRLVARAADPDAPVEDALRFAQAARSIAATGSPTRNQDRPSRPSAWSTPRPMTTREATESALRIKADLDARRAAKKAQQS